DGRRNGDGCYPFVGRCIQPVDVVIIGEAPAEIKRAIVGIGQSRLRIGSETGVGSKLYPTAGAIWSLFDVERNGAYVAIVGGRDRHGPGLRISCTVSICTYFQLIDSGTFGGIEVDPGCGGGSLPGHAGIDGYCVDTCSAGQGDVVYWQSSLVDCQGAGGRRLFG